MAPVLAAPLAAQTPDEPDPATAYPSRINEIIVYGDEPCPEPSTPDEIVVCVRRGEEEALRLPERFRPAPDSPANQSWAQRQQELAEAGESGIGSCSPVGAGGETGCWVEMMEQYREAETNEPE
ncbi:MAG: hypothetical protein ACFBQW_00850 [Sphingomonadaceae bacterium]